MTSSLESTSTEPPTRTWSKCKRNYTVSLRKDLKQKAIMQLLLCYIPEINVVKGVRRTRGARTLISPKEQGARRKNART